MSTRELFRSAADRVARAADATPEVSPLCVPIPPPAGLAAPKEARSGPPPKQGGVARMAAAVREGALTAGAAVQQCLERVRRYDATLQAFVTLLQREAMQSAEALDAERRAGRLRGPLHGVPVTVKDVIDVAGVPTTASSRVLDGVVADRDAAVVARLRAAGAIVLGKTQTHEFALGVTTPQSRNPWDPSRIAGGSTGGSAIAVATAMAPGAVGTDTRASIRVPAALTGVVGFKPTFGLLPTDGVVTLSWSMDHVAPMAATVDDTALLLDVMAARDDGPYRTWAGAPVHGLRVGVPAAAFEDAQPDVARAVDLAIRRLRELGIVVCAVDSPSARDFEMTNAAGLIVSRVEAATFHAPWLTSRPDRYTPETFAQLDEARRLPAVTYLTAQRLREDFRARMLALMQDIDLLAMPTSLVEAPRVEEAERFLLVLSRTCVPWSFIGFPALSLPCGRTRRGLPIGLQLIARPWEDGPLIAVGTAVEQLELYDPRMDDSRA